MRILQIIVFTVGLILLGQSLYMEAKAKLAQVLIARSWAASSDDANTVSKPWWWADTRAIAKLTVPRLKESVFIMQDTSGESLAFGPGHLPSSAAPAQPGHVVIAGHRDSHFEFLQHLEVGDVIHTQNHQSSKKRYRVSEVRVLNALEESLEQSDQNQLSLITCYPFNGLVPGGPLRYIVTAEAI